MLSKISDASIGILSISFQKQLVISSSSGQIACKVEFILAGSIEKGGGELSVA